MPTRRDGADGPVWHLPAGLAIVGAAAGFRLTCNDCPWTSREMNPRHDADQWRETAEGHACGTF